MTRWRDCGQRFTWWSIFAILLAFVTSKHELYLDEVQPWLWVRYEPNLLVSIQHLRYEAHPALWTVLLFLVSRISPNVVLMHWINYLLAIVCAWLIISPRLVPLRECVLVLFGGSFFFVAGVLARNYMLPAMLLIAAARCLLAAPKRPWIALLLLALAINAHFLAIPVVASLCIWLYWLEPEMTVRGAVAKLRDRTFWIYFASIVIALVACFLTVRPAPDVLTTENIQGATLFQYLVLGVGRIWHYLVPITLDDSSAIRNGALSIAAYRDLVVSLLLFFVSLAVLPSRRSRYFMSTASVLFIACALFTVRRPLETHLTLLVTSYIIALFMRRAEDGLGSWLPEYVGQPVLITILAMQVLICAQFALKEITHPFSAGKSVADWIEREGLAEHPLVSQPEIAAPAVLAYTGIRTVYFPACRCSRPYVLYRSGWENERRVTRSELDALRVSTGLSPILLSKWALSEDERKQMGLRLGFESPPGWGFVNEDVYVYVAEAPTQ